jgi:sodium/proline symporter
MMMTIFFAYLLLVLVVGAIASRYGRSMEGYFLADRRLGAWVTAISATASSESGWLVLGLVGEAYMWGAKAVWTAHGCLLGFVMNWYLIAPRLRRQSAELNAITVPGFLGARMGGPGHAVRLVGVGIIFFALLGYVAAQFTATGKAFQGAFGIPYQSGVLLGAAITILYTLVGGFRAVSWTDLAQGLLMVFGLVVLPIVTVASIGGPGVLFEKLREVPPRVEGVFNVTSGPRLEQIGVEEQAYAHPDTEIEIRREETEDDYRFLVDGPAYRLNDAPASGERELSVGDRVGTDGEEIGFDKVNRMVGGEDMADPFGGAVGAAMLGWVIGLFGIGLGYPGQPHILTRFMASKSIASLRRGRVIALAWGALVLYGAVLLGHAGRLAIPQIVDPEQAYPVLAGQLLPPVLAGIVLAAIVSAMMSTADSQLLVISSGLSRDLIQKTFTPNATTRSLQIISRLSVLVLGLIALAVALGEVRAVFWFVLFAWSGLGSAFGPPILFSVFWKRTSRAGVIAGMVSGAGVTVVWKLWLKAIVGQATGFTVYELVPAFATSMLLTWLFSVLFPPDESDQRRAAGLIGSEDA